MTASNHLILQHPAPGFFGPTRVVEYTAQEWAAGQHFSPDLRERLESGVPQCVGPTTIVVDLLAYYRLTRPHDAAAMAQPREGALC